MQHLFSFLRRDEILGVVLIVSAFLSIALIAVILVQTIRLSKLGKRLDMLTRGANGETLESTLNSHLDAVQNSLSRVESLEKATKLIQEQLPTCIQRVNLLRYDAFEDVGGEQSFALALLDLKGDGVVVSTMFSRQDMRVYAKQVSGGRSVHSLSREEENVLKKRG